jgi:hypothetical protein
MPVKDPSEGCHGIKEAAILAALQRIRLCEAAAESWTSWRSGYRRAGPPAAGPYDLGEVYEFVCQFIGKGGKLPVYARWIEGGGRMVTGNGAAWIILSAVVIAVWPPCG